MRASLFILLLAALLLATAPAQAQLRPSGSAIGSSVRLYDQGTSGFSLNRFFTPQVFRMSHTFEASSSSFGGGSSMAMYTNTMQWQFNNKLAARLDVAAASQLGGNERLAQALGQNTNQIFLRNAEVAYRPGKNVEFHLSLRRSPYGSWMSPYGHGYGYGAYDRFNHSSSFRADFGPSVDDLFWDQRKN
ncbi:MAG: hypothetical protein O3C45_08015 [Bacteroidetes bacterium]|nr:hypothetical protein [Bacteroidota bacterium]